MNKRGSMEEISVGEYSIHIVKRENHIIIGRAGAITRAKNERCCRCEEEEEELLLFVETIVAVTLTVLYLSKL